MTAANENGCTCPQPCTAHDMLAPGFREKLAGSTPPPAQPAAGPPGAPCGFLLLPGGQGEVLTACGGCGARSSHSLPASLENLLAWAQAHRCGPALPPDAWLRAAEAAQRALDGTGEGGASLDAAAAAVGAAVAAVWPELRAEAERVRGTGQ